MIAKLLLPTVAVVALIGCSGQMEPPSIDQLQKDGTWFTLTTPSGKTVPCWTYGSRGKGLYGESPTWFDVECDWNAG